MNGGTMKKTIILTLITLLLAAPLAVAQTDCSPNCLQNPGDSGGSGGGGSCQDCQTQQNGDRKCVSVQSECNPLDYLPWQCVAFRAYTFCQEHNTSTAHYCGVDGTCYVYSFVGLSLHEGNEEWQVEMLTDYFQQSGLISENDLAEWMYTVDQPLRGKSSAERSAARLAAYRAKFTALTGDKLRPGEVPVIGSKPQKNLKSVIVRGI
jgi:hypothetical protein